MKPDPQTAFPLDSTPSNAAGKAEGAKKANNGWKPICEAPRDGTKVLGTWASTWPDSPHIEAVTCNGEYWWYAYDGDSPSVPPTHFQPLPEPPTL